MPVNLRPKASGHEVFGNFTFMVPVVTRPADRAEPTATVEAIRRRTQRIKRQCTPADAVRLLDVLQHLPLPDKQGIARLATSERVIPTAILSNLGRLDDDLDFGTELRASEVWFSPPARMPMGLAVGALTVAGRLHLVLRYRHPLFGPAEIAGFADSYRAALGHLALALESDHPDEVLRASCRGRGRHRGALVNVGGDFAEQRCVLRYGDVVALSGDFFAGPYPSEDLFRLAAIPGERGTKLGTRDEIVCALKVMAVDGGVVDPGSSLGDSSATTSSPRLRRQPRWKGGRDRLDPGHRERRSLRRPRPLGTAADRNGPQPPRFESAVAAYRHLHKMAIDEACRLGRYGGDESRAMAREAAPSTISPTLSRRGTCALR